MAMFGRFTERAQKVILFAQEEAKQLGHNYVGTEHLLLGLLKEGEGVAAKVLINSGVDLNKVRQQVINLIGYGNEAGELLGFTPRTKRVFELSLIEAKNLGHNYIGTEHILLGLIREGEGVAATILKGLGMDLSKARKEILGMLDSSFNRRGQKGNRRGNMKTPTLDKFGRDLTRLAQEGKLDPVIGRSKEIERVIQVLSRRTKNNPCLIGEPGVGKTAIAEGLAQKIVEGNVPEILKNKKVVTLDLASMVAGAKYRGEFEDRLKKVMEEIRRSGDIILFIDEMHTIIGAGAAEGAIDASNILKPALARGELQAIGATTLDEYRKYIEKDPALERRFQPILVEEPTVEDTIKILEGLRDKYEAHHRVKITDEAIKAAAELSSRYITDRYLPDKAIDLIDEAASKVRLQSITAPPDLTELEKKLEELYQEKEEAISTQNFEKAAKLRDEEKRIKEELERKKEEWRHEKQSKSTEVGYEDIAQVVSSWTGIPVKKLAEEESERLLKMEEILHKRVIGQEQAVKAVSNAIRRARVGLKDPNRPIGSFIFLGPTGVGKTELSKALAEALFGDENAMIRVDMSEYMEKHSVSKLVGSPPGYVGYEEGGQLTEKVRRKPYSVILFDEIEKAHPDVFNILLQLLDDGRLTDAKGRVVDFKNTVIIMTSNVGASTIKKQKTLGFAAQKDQEKEEYEKMKENIMEELRKSFRPEFLNRIDEVIVFHPLNKEHIKQIVDLMVKDLENRLKALNINIKVTEKAKEYLAKEGYDPTYGARPLKRSITKLIEDKLSEEILKGNISKDDNIVVDFDGEKLTFNRE
ncbi:ATP-dependent Clp protease ATP-binding subunit ClpC [Caloranaerobacter azorensis DSM 13643]|uniref:ATP-dependent Clp protease ATP-binding subunit ClpC n=2 Tax=Caloranaerobacter azorensis TaxID=116090 RepID=A0A1M5V4M8_9FIRM|nr:ATP-dependent Clp protease ATP-binding subunit [Caloranaerobacter azorensis]SHH70202.1 ATP-dependent Clp protease ATP-binding subunit ClpC [Caloranaerobacter azorensis DSM 13643]